MKKATSMFALLALAACGSDSPTSPSPPVPQIAGKYNGYPAWLVQWNRSRDGVIGSFTCYGTVTLSQSESMGGIASLTGFMVVAQPCPAQSFDLTGTVQADGSLHFRSGGPKPPEGQCPAAPVVEYAGVVSQKVNYLELSARGTVMLDCPGPGEGPQQMDYIVSASRNN
ncbi:MAG TPA: hypothetical protein VN461_21490 [Vicinamibacteria bacterium]|jgi:hypothetical protein|nr:hypothetical protein [Vicinamibacteria bacterium]